MSLFFSCRLHGVPFIVAFLVPVCLIIFGNMVTFCLIIRSLIKSGDKVTAIKKVSGFQQARKAIAITVLLGLTWIFGVLAIRDAKLAFEYLFCIFNTLQGLFIFIFFCVLPTTTREKLRNLFQKAINRHRQGQHQNATDKNIEFNILADSNGASTLPTNPTSTSTLPTNPTSTSTLSTNPNSTSTLPTNPNSTSTLPTNPNSTSTVHTNPNSTSVLPTNPSSASTLPTNPSSTSTLPTIIELKFKDPTADDEPDAETPLTSNDDFLPEFENLAPAHYFKSRDEIFSNPNVTRYSTRKQGSNYVTTIEMNVNN